MNKVTADRECRDKGTEQRASGRTLTLGKWKPQYFGSGVKTGKQL